jgi:hypothetical protein
MHSTTIKNSFNHNARPGQNFNSPAKSKRQKAEKKAETHVVSMGFF